MKKLNGCLEQTRIVTCVLPVWYNVTKNYYDTRRLCIPHPDGMALAAELGISRGTESVGRGGEGALSVGDVHAWVRVWTQGPSQQ